MIYLHNPSFATVAEKQRDKATSIMVQNYVDQLATEVSDILSPVISAPHPMDKRMKLCSVTLTYAKK